jgi:hypothetical protein
VVAVLLPEARRVDVEELEGAQPLARLPEVELGQYQAHRATVVGLEVLAVVLERQQHVVVHQICCDGGAAAGTTSPPGAGGRAMIVDVDAFRVVQARPG